MIRTENNRNRICFAFVSVHFRNQLKFSFGLFWCFGCIMKQPKQTDLFQNEPNQTENGLKNSNSTQKTLSFQLQFPKQIETNRFVSKWTETNRKWNGLKNSNSTQKMLSFQLQFPKQTKKTDLFQNEPKQTENGLNFNAISLTHYRQHSCLQSLKISDWYR